MFFLKEELIKQVVVREEEFIKPVGDLKEEFIKPVVFFKGGVYQTRDSL